MPFKSDKQQRWMWANEPRIAREWTDRYGAKHGGIMKGLNRRNYLTGADGIMDIDTMYNEDMQFAPDVSGEYWSNLYDSAKTGAGKVYDFVSDSIISPAWAPENESMNNSMYVEELPSIYNPAREYGQFFRNKPVNERTFMTPIKEGILGAKDFISENIIDPMSVAYDKTQGGVLQIPSLIGMIANTYNPLNPDARNYNPGLQESLDYLSGIGGSYRDPNTGLLKGGLESLQGKNLVSAGWFSDTANDIGAMMEQSIARTRKTINNLDKQWSNLKKTNPAKFNEKLKFHQDKLARKKKEKENFMTHKKEQEANRIAKEKAAAKNFMTANPKYGNQYDKSKDHSGAGGYGHTASSPGATTGSAARSSHSRSSDLGFSDIRLKDNVELIGQSPSNINIYKFNYLNDPTVYQGVMAQDVPWATVKADNGYLMVDYNKVDVEFKKWHKK